MKKRKTASERVNERLAELEARTIRTGDGVNINSTQSVALHFTPSQPTEE